MSFNVGGKAKRRGLVVGHRCYSPEQVCLIKDVRMDTNNRVHSIMLRECACEAWSETRFWTPVCVATPLGLLPEQEEQEDDVCGGCGYGPCECVDDERGYDCECCR